MSAGIFFPWLNILQSPLKTVPSSCFLSRPASSPPSQPPKHHLVSLYCLLNGHFNECSISILKCTEHKTETGFLPGQFPSPLLVDSFLPLSHPATQLKFAEPESRERGYERRGNLLSHCFRKSLLETCSLEETKCSKDIPVHPLFPLKPKALRIQCMAKSNYQDNYCYLHCPTVVFCNQKLYW